MASLRIYEPLNSFPAADQLRWSSIPIQSYTGRDEELRALTRTIILEPPSLKADGPTSLIMAISAMSHLGLLQEDVGQR